MQSFKIISGLIARDHLGLFFPHPVITEPYYKDGYTSYYGQRESDYQDFTNSGVNDGDYVAYDYQDPSYSYQSIYSNNEEFVFS